jgi:hypothetical protein
MKTCTKCNKLKFEDMFYTKGKTLQAYCKECFNHYCIVRWKNKKVKVIESLGNCCYDCKKTYPPEVYQFHHINPSEKDFDWGKMRQLSIAKMEKELSKCVLLCANCHILRHSKIYS